VSESSARSGQSVKQRQGVSILAQQQTARRAQQWQVIPNSSSLRGSAAYSAHFLFIVHRKTLGLSFLRLAVGPLEGLSNGYDAGTP
jgi:hypothetical protein